MKRHIKTGDSVVVLWGEEKGKTGKVTKVYPKQGLALVEGVGFVKRHQKPRKAGQKGQILDKQQPIRIAKLMTLTEAEARLAKRKKVGKK